MIYKIEAVTTKHGNIFTFRIYVKKRFLFIPYWKFMSNQGSLHEAEEMVKSIYKINSLQLV